MLGQLDAAVPQHLGAVDDAVHQDVLAGGELAALLPHKGAAFRQDALVGDDVAGVVDNMLVDIVAQKQVHRLLHGGKLPQAVHDLGQGLAVQPVVGIHDLEIEAAGVAHALVDALAMAAVLLMDDADDVRVLGGVLVGNAAGVVGGAVVHQDDLGFLAGGQQRLDAAVHVGGGIVAGHGKGDQFHGLHSILRFRGPPWQARCARPGGHGCRDPDAGAARRRARRLLIQYSIPVFAQKGKSCGAFCAVCAAPETGCAESTLQAQSSCQASSMVSAENKNEPLASYTSMWPQTLRN